MFERPHHRRIAKLLRMFNRELLQEAECYFGGGTAIVLALGEYRESVDIDFLCSSNEGWRLLRNTVSAGLGKLLAEPVQHVRDVRTDQYRIYTILEFDGTPVKVELVREARISLQGSHDPILGVPVLSRSDLYAEKMLANADRGLDKGFLSRDIIDLALMIEGWGDIPEQAWQKAHAAYGAHLAKAFHLSVGLICDQRHLASCLGKMHMAEELADRIPAILENAAARLPLDGNAGRERDRRIADLPTLEKEGDAVAIFWGQAASAIKAAGSPDKVDWPEVERLTVKESIGSHGLPSGCVADVVCKHSPGAVAVERQAVVRANVERDAPRLQLLYEQWQAHGANNDPEDEEDGPKQ
jgi:hypothetical protein